MHKIIYIASPYTYHDPIVVEENFRRVSRYAAKLVSEGSIAISPITYGHTLVQFHNMPTDWPFWSNFCLRILERCNEMHVYMMEGWDKSRGVKEEIEYAESLGIEIKYIPFMENQIEKRAMTWEEQVQWVMKNTDVEWENLYIVEEIAKSTTPKYIVTATIGDKIEVSYE